MTDLFQINFSYMKLGSSGGSFVIWAFSIPKSFTEKDFSFAA
jgi:hypothetical protein